MKKTSGFFTRLKQYTFFFGIPINYVHKNPLLRKLILGIFHWWNALLKLFLNLIKCWRKSIHQILPVAPEKQLKSIADLYKYGAAPRCLLYFLQSFPSTIKVSCTIAIFILACDKFAILVSQRVFMHFNISDKD
jgi:hypothetical protein